MTDVDALAQPVPAPAGEQAAVGQEVGMAAHLATNQRLYEEALAHIDDLYRAWRGPELMPVESAATGPSSDPGAQPTEGEAPVPTADRAQSWEPASESGDAVDGTAKILLRTLKQLSA